jgi:Tfp pilus assembly protein PilF
MVADSGILDSLKTIMTLTLLEPEGRNAEFHCAVSRISNPQTQRTGPGLPNGIRRYSRLKTCATRSVVPMRASENVVATVERFARAALTPLLVSLLLVTGCRKAPETAPPPALVVEAMNRGVSLMGQYQYDQAAQAFQDALQADPGLNEAKLNLAIALFNRNRKEDLDAAGKLLDELLQKAPDNVRTLYFKAIVLQHVGKAEQAVPCLEKVVQQQPDDGAAWYLLALCKQRSGQAAEAEFLRAVDRRPYLFSAYYQLYQIAMRAGQEDRAKGYLDQFKKLRESPLGESIELPQYNQMGDLALARPLAVQTPRLIASATYRAGPAKQLISVSPAPGAPSTPAAAALSFGGAAFADVDRDGTVDLLLPAWLPESRGLSFYFRGQGGSFFPGPTNAGLEFLESPLVCAVGDFNNDEIPDLFVACVGTNHLYQGQTNGIFLEATGPAGITAGRGTPRSALWLDADHDGDLDLFVCVAGGPNQLFNNNGDGGFTNIAVAAGVALPDGGAVMVLPGDLDGDRDMDLVLLRADAPAKVFLNDLLGKYREADLQGLDMRGDLGGALQDFNGDGTLDLLVLGGSPAELKLFLGDGRGRFKPAEAFAESTRVTASWGPLLGVRVADLDLDGDLDIACFGAEGHVLLNDGAGRFVLQPRVWTRSAGTELAGMELCDLNGDFVPDLLLLERRQISRASVVPGELSLPSTALSFQPSGIRSRDGRTRSPASGYGASLTVRAGLREQRLLYTGQSGGFNQSQLCAVFGLGGARQADFVQILWPDGVAQVEMAVAAGGSCQKLAELQRKISSCPVLFAWNGTRFEFVTDFAGVGGLGYFSAPGVSAPPQVLEHVKIEPGQLQSREGCYELRVTEPMEESAYIDRLELLAIDHATNQPVFPDERLALNGPAPTHELLVAAQPIFPVRAFAPSGRECADRLARVDRIYAYEPALDRRYIGFCSPHTLELDFGDPLAGFSRDDRVFLFINGFIEYPYSQTVYAAGQSRIGWEPIQVECQEPDGRWKSVVPDGGVFGGMARTMTIELTGLLSPTTRKLRLTTNLEVRYDQIFIAGHAGRDHVSVRTAPLLEATLRRVGFAREYSPDGRLPLIYDYELSDTTAPFHVLKGAYTRYGPVKELLASFDDRYVVMGPGDEVALKFGAAGLPAVPAGQMRSFVLVSHAYCKDMDLYTATPRTVEPLPFRTMSRYPYPPTERYPVTEEHQAFLRLYNTRLVE